MPEHELSPEQEGENAQNAADTVIEREARNQHEYFHRIGSYVRYELEDDLYTNAFVSFFEVSRKTDLFSQMEGWFNKLVPILYMIAVNSIQLLTTYAVSNHVMGPMKKTREFYMLTALDLFIGSNQTLPSDLSGSICGSFEQVEIGDGRYAALNVNVSNHILRWGPGQEGSFYSIPQPTRTWGYEAENDDHPVLWDALSILEGGTTLWPFTQNSYSALFILMVAVWMFTLVVEFRAIFHFANMLVSLRKTDWSDPHPDLRYQDDSRSFEIIHLSARPLVAGMAIALLRLLVACFLLVVGTALLYSTVSKFDLILNSLALVFVLQLDNITYQASVAVAKQTFIHNIDPPVYRAWHTGQYWSMRLMKLATPIFIFAFALLFGFTVRALQVAEFEEVFYRAGAICMFAAPPPLFSEDHMAPATGMCESLLSATCFPDFPTSTLWGPCLVTDMRYGYPATFAEPISSELWAVSGSKLPYTSWSLPLKYLYTTAAFSQFNKRRDGVFIASHHQDIMRKVCASMYNPTGSLDSRVVDPDTAEAMRGAPFYCEKRHLFPAVFAEYFDGTPSPRPKRLDSQTVVQALHNCRDDLFSFAFSAPTPPTTGPPVAHSVNPMVHSGKKKAGPPVVHSPTPPTTRPPVVLSANPMVHSGKKHAGPPVVHSSPPGVHSGPPVVHSGPPVVHSGLNVTTHALHEELQQKETQSSMAHRSWSRGKVRFRGTST